MEYMDQSGLYAMEEVLQGLVQKGVTVLFVNLLEQPRYLMEGIDIIPELVPEDHIFGSFKSCMHWIRENNPIPKS
jgi:SulP family sulfate permease